MAATKTRKKPKELKTTPAPTNGKMTPEAYRKIAKATKAETRFRMRDMERMAKKTDVGDSSASIRSLVAGMRLKLRRAYNATDWSKGKKIKRRKEPNPEKKAAKVEKSKKEPKEAPVEPPESLQVDHPKKIGIRAMRREARHAIKSFMRKAAETPEEVTDKDVKYVLTMIDVLPRREKKETLEALGLGKKPAIDHEAISAGMEKVGEEIARKVVKPEKAPLGTEFDPPLWGDNADETVGKMVQEQVRKELSRKGVASPPSSLLMRGDLTYITTEATERELPREEMVAFVKDGVQVMYHTIERRILARYKKDEISIFPFMPRWWIKFRILIFKERMDWLDGSSSRQARRKTRKWNKRARKMRKISGDLEG